MEPIEDEPKEHQVPTPEEAKQMFLDSPGLTSIWTTEGTLQRADSLGGAA